MINKIKLDDIELIAKKAGIAIMEIYRKDFSVEYKEDNSPITEADLKANQIICSSLTKLYPTIPIMSEENNEIAYEIRKNWEYYWCIDPIDGTKEFVKKNGEFTINIALIYKTTPVLGVVYIPVTEDLYKAKKGEGGFKNGVKIPLTRDDNLYIIAISNSHLTQEYQKFVEKISSIKEKKVVRKGSSLKLCMVASGEVDIYPRLAPCMEWDTAAADAIIRESGKLICQFTNNKPLIYNKKNLLNPYFIAK